MRGCMSAASVCVSVGVCVRACGSTLSAGPNWAADNCRVMYGLDGAAGQSAGLVVCNDFSRAALIRAGQRSSQISRPSLEGVHSVHHAQQTHENSPAGEQDWTANAIRVSLLQNMLLVCTLGREAHTNSL